VALNLPDFSQAKILVAGDVMLDRYWAGPTQRISPEAPVPVVRVTAEELRAGGAANVALNIAALGARAEVLGLVGQDEQAERLRERLDARGVQASLIAGTAPTITKLRLLSRHQQLLRVDFEEPLAPMLADGRFAAAYAQALPQAQVVVLSDYGKGTLAEVAPLLAVARAQGKPVLIDPKGSDWRAYAGATLITPNLGELQAVVGTWATDAEMLEKAARLRQSLGLTALLVTRSEHGMSLLSDAAPLHLPALAREVYDVTGAGDTVIATFAAALASGVSMADCARLANVAAGIVVGKLGTASVNPAELQAAIKPAPVANNRGVLAQADLLLQVSAAKQRGERVVMTNGCFDLLHVGHLRYLQAAKALGDVLIVAVNTDASVQRLKGPTRPLNRCDDRMAILAGLVCVDYVTPFADDTPAALIAAVLPDVLVKGGDYRVEDIAGYAEVTGNGGEVRVLDFHDGYSTTQLIRQAQR
jgi:D-beta-D-heptose 7-phosphate kinase/D-beta-D-heptose 1-phosphate adenosyltransferase